MAAWILSLGLLAQLAFWIGPADSNREIIHRFNLEISFVLGNLCSGYVFR